MASTNPALDMLLKLRGQITFFKGLTPNEITDLLFNIRFKKFEPNEILFNQGDNKTQEIYYLLKGSVELFVGEHNVASISKPTLFGEMRSFIGEARTATAKSGTEGSTLITFLIKESHEEVSPLAFAKLYKNIIKSLSTKIMDMNSKL